MTRPENKHIKQYALGFGPVLLLLLVVLIINLSTLHYQNADRVAQDQYLDTYPPVPSPFLQSEEVVVLETITATGTATELLPVDTVLFKYIRVTDSCDENYTGDCLVVRSGPGTEFDAVQRLRNNVVLKVAGQVKRDDRVWFKIAFDEVLRYPERVSGDWYVAAEYVEVVLDEGNKTLEGQDETITLKKIIVDRSDQRLYAYEDDVKVMDLTISTGLALTPTPRGTFSIFKKTPSRYMQGPLPNLPADQYYDLPGVPWNLYFTHQGAVIHGAYWHDSFGTPYSHGCVNVSPDEAYAVYTWADIGTPVIVRD